MGFIQKTFGGLDKAYYFRHLFFAIIFGAIFIAFQYNTFTHIVDRNLTDAQISSMQMSNVVMYIYIVICMFLYPYARFVYESIMNFLMGENVFFINIFILFFWRLFVMMMLFCFAPIIAPIGLLYLWYYHSKNHTFDENYENENG